MEIRKCITSKKSDFREFKTFTSTHDKSQNQFDYQEKTPSILQPRKRDGTEEPIR